MNCKNYFDLSEQLKGNYYNLLINSDNTSNVNYFIYYIGQNNAFKYVRYLFNTTSEKSDCVKSGEISNIKLEDQKNINCQFYKVNYVLCFLKSNSRTFSYVFDINMNIISQVSSFTSLETIKNNNNFSVKSSISNDENTIFVCWKQDNNQVYYSFLSNPFSFGNIYENIKDCNNKNNLIETHYLSDEKKFVFLCGLGDDNKDFKIYSKKENEYMLNGEVIISINDKGFITYKGKYLFYYNSNKECNSSEYNEFSSYTNNKNNQNEAKENSSFFKSELISNLKNETIFNNFDIADILKGKEPGKIYEIKEKDFSFIIKPTNSIKEPNSTFINFKECESILRNYYNISNSSFITLLILELYNNNSKSLINQVEYEAYDHNFTKLNLKLCKDVNIPIYYNIKEDALKDIDIDKIKTLKNLGIDVFNINDSFFWEVCKPYSDTGNDLILEDRIKDLYQNFSLCEDGCTYKDLSLDNMTVLCDCKIKENITTVVSDINLDKIKYETTSNFDIIKCYDIIFKFKLKLTNIGFWIFTVILILHFILLFYYFYTGVQPVYDFVINQMVKFGYLSKKKNDNIKNEIKRKKKVYRKKSKKNIKDNPPPKTNINKNNNIITNVFIIKKKLTKKGNNYKEQNSSERTIKKHKNKKLGDNSKNDRSKLQMNRSKKFNLTNMQTQNPVEDNNEKNNKNNNDFPLISFNLDKKNKNDYIPKKSNRILNNYTYEEAMEYDKRDLCEIFFIYLLSKQIIFHTFFFKTPFSLFSLRLCLLIFIFSSDLALNAFFYFNDNISKKYHYAKGLFLFTFSNNITVIILSTFIGFVLLTLFTKLSNSTNAIREIFRNEEEKMKKNDKYIVENKRKKEIKEEIDNIFKNFKLKVIVFISVELLFIIFFWYYVIIFCHVYPSTQTSWLFDSFLSMLSRLIIDSIICLGLAKLYRIGVDSNIHCIYKFAMFLYEF